MSSWVPYSWLHTFKKIFMSFIFFALIFSFRLCGIIVFHWTEKDQSLSTPPTGPDILVALVVNERKFFNLESSFQMGHFSSPQIQIQIFQMGHSSSTQASTEHQVLQVWTHITIPYSNPFRTCCLNIIFRILANAFLSQMFGKIFLGDKHYNAMELSALEIFWPKSC